MALGVLNNLSAIYAENNLNNTNNSLQSVLQQLSSGSRINSGADDSAGLSLVNGLQANSTALTQSATNATEGVGLLRVADGALSQVTNLLNRAITLATEASNGTLNSTQAAAANQEYQSILAEINNIGSTTTYNQQQVFGGRTVAIYTGDSSTIGSSIDNLSIRELSSANIGDSAGEISYSNGQNNVFIDLSKGGTNAAVTDSLGAAGSSTTLTVTYLTKGAGGSTVTATAPITVGAGTTYANTVQGMIDAINDSGLGIKATFATATQAGTTAVLAAQDANATTAGSGVDTGIEISGPGVGTGTNGTGVVGALTVAGSSDTLAGNLMIVASDGKTHNIQLGLTNSTDTISDLASTINGDGYGVTASVTGNTLTFTSAASTVTVTGTGMTDTTPSVVNSAPTLASIAGTLTVAASYDVLGGTLNVTDSAGNSHTVALGTANSTDTMADLLHYFNVTNSSWGITAAANGAGTSMTFTGTGSAALAGASLTDTTPALTRSTALTKTPTIGTPFYAQVGTFSVASSGDALSGTLQIGQNTITLGSPGSTATISQLKTFIDAGNYGVKATLDGTGTVLTFTSTNSAMTFGGTPRDAGTLDPVTTTNNADYSGYYSLGISGAISDQSTGGGTLVAGMVTDTDGMGGIATTSYSDGVGEDLSSTDLTTQANASTALGYLNLAIADTAALDGYIGGQINTLNAVSSVITTQQENLVSAQNAIQATDYASATSNMSKFEILSQTGIAALAQANSVQQEVTKLLQ